MTVLCGASAYEEKYYFNPAFQALPAEIQEELRVISILFVDEIGGVFLMEFDGDGTLRFETSARDSDYNYDEIGAGLMVREIRSSRREMLASLELFYKAVFLGEADIE